MRAFIPAMLGLSLLAPPLCHAQIAATPTPSVAAQKPVLAFTATRKRLEKESTTRGNAMITGEQWAYDVTVENRGFAEVAGLEIEYRVFVFDDRGRGSDRREPLRKTGGTATINSIARSGKATFQTEPARIEKSQLHPDWQYMDGTGTRITDRLKGIWVRAKQNGQVIAEWMNPTTLKDKETWEIQPPAPAGSRRP